VTTQAFSKTVTMTGAAIAFDAKAEFKTPGISSPGFIWIYNRSGSAEIGVAYRPGITAAIDGDDTKHIGPQGFFRFPYTDTISVIGPTGTKVEFSNDMGVF
jgi:hypothetical protein